MNFVYTFVSLTMVVISSAAFEGFPKRSHEEEVRSSKEYEKADHKGLISLSNRYDSELKRLEESVGSSYYEIEKKECRATYRKKSVLAGCNLTRAIQTYNRKKPLISNTHFDRAVVLEAYRYAFHTYYSLISREKVVSVNGYLFKSGSTIPLEYSHDLSRFSQKLNLNEREFDN